MSKESMHPAGTLPDVEIDRRALLKGSLLAGGAVLAGASAGTLVSAPSVAAEPAAVPKKWDLEVELLALGSSCGGLLAAIAGHDRGLRSAVLEASDLLGGGTARSNGGMWIPNSRHQKEAGHPDSKEIALAYIRSTSFGRHDEDKASAFLDRGPETLDYVNTRTPLKTVGSLGGDYYTHLPDSRAGRMVWPDLASAAKLFEQRTKYPLLSKVRPPATRMGVGGQKGVTEDFGGGTALIGGLVAGCIDRQIPIMLNARARRLIIDQGRVVGVQVEREGRDFHVKATRAVVIATGGFEWNDALNRQFAPIPDRIYPVTAPTNVGDGHIMGMEIGAGLAMMDCAVWMAALITPGEPDWGIGIGGRGGSTITAYPGVIYVNRLGKRVCNEGFYPDVPRAMFNQPSTKESAYENYPLFWIMDQAVRDKFGIGPLPPGNNEMRPWFQRAQTIKELAQQVGINADNLQETVNRYNAFSKQGLDSDFGRGPERPNEMVRAARTRAEPNSLRDQESAAWLLGQLGTVEKPPFYVAKLGIGSVGHRGGLVTNPAAQVLTVRGQPVPGLYATSNAAAQLAVGAGYSSGQSIAQSLVFGYVAAQHISQPS